MAKLQLFIIVIILLAVGAAFFDFPFVYNAIARQVHLPEWHPKDFTFGLDLKGGTHLVYEADVSLIPENEQDSAMSGLKDVIERRVDAFGVSEPVVQVERSGSSHRLVVELAGITDVNAAIQLIGGTPFLEFKELPQSLHNSTNSTFDDLVPTGLTGKFLTKARMDFDTRPPYKPLVDLQFNDEGTRLFAEITKRNLNIPVAIFLDGVPISSPVVQSEITDGRAVISGNFTVAQAQQLAERLNAGALPVPISLLSQQTIGASLGEASLRASLIAGLVSLVVMAIFMTLWYRLPGLLAVAALFVYITFVLAIFKLVPVTLTLAGIAGFIISLGISLDANILIFERMKEEGQLGKGFSMVVQDGFSRAWTSIRDSNLTTIFTSIVLYAFGTGTIKGFALTLLIGVSVGMFSSITVTRSFLRVLAATKAGQWRFLLRMPKKV